ncbi:MAG TPA: hypothetical protein VHY21_00665 [Pseudonocardiaceae bacterium]|nr:hypothetical protein [Pseudonocardiaceae bacterium]
MISCTGLTASVLACSPAQADSAAAAAATIRQEETSWIEALAAGQIDATVSYYGDGALLLAPNAPIARPKSRFARPDADIRVRFRQGRPSLARPPRWTCPAPVTWPTP